MKKGTRYTIFSVVYGISALTIGIYGLMSHAQNWTGFGMLLGAIGTSLVSLALTLVISFLFNGVVVDGKWKVPGDLTIPCVIISDGIVSASVTTLLFYQTETALSGLPFWSVCFPLTIVTVPAVVFFAVWLLLRDALIAESKEKQCKKDEEENERKMVVEQFLHYVATDDEVKELINVYKEKRRELNVRYAGGLKMRYINEDAYHDVNITNILLFNYGHSVDNLEILGYEELRGRGVFKYSDKGFYDEGLDPLAVTQVLGKDNAFGFRRRIQSDLIAGFAGLCRSDAVLEICVSRGLEFHKAQGVRRRNMTRAVRRDVENKVRAAAYRAEPYSHQIVD